MSLTQVLGAALEASVAPVLTLPTGEASDQGASFGLEFVGPFDLRGDKYGLATEGGVSYDLMDHSANRNLGWNAGMRFDFYKPVDNDMSWGLRFSADYVGRQYLSSGSEAHGIGLSFMGQLASDSANYDRYENWHYPVLTGAFGPWFNYFPNQKIFETGLKLIIGWDIT